MGFLYITEYQVEAREPCLAFQKLEIGVDPTISAALHSATRTVRLLADESCSVSFGIKPVVTTEHPRLLADEEYYRHVEPGQGLRIAVILNE